MLYISTLQYYIFDSIQPALKLWHNMVMYFCLNKDGFIFKCIRPWKYHHITVPFNLLIPVSIEKVLAQYGEAKWITRSTSHHSAAAALHANTLWNTENGVGMMTFGDLRWQNYYLSVICQYNKQKLICRSHCSSTYLFFAESNSKAM